MLKQLCRLHFVCALHVVTIHQGSSMQGDMYLAGRGTSLSYRLSQASRQDSSIVDGSLTNFRNTIIFCGSATVAIRLQCMKKCVT